MDRKKNKMKRDYIVPEIIVMKMDVGELLAGSGSITLDGDTTTDEQCAPKYHQLIDDESAAAGGFGK